MREIGKTLCNITKQNFIIEKVKSLSNIYGYLAEIGVYSGVTASLIAENETKNTIYLFDTFDGIPYVNENDNHHKVGDFNDVLFTDVENYFKKFKNVKLCKGIFPKETAHLIDSNAVFKFVHIDVDVYQSYKDCLEFFYPKMIKGGIIIFDDYNVPTCAGATKACDEFFKDKTEEIKLLLNSYYIEKL